MGLLTNWVDLSDLQTTHVTSILPVSRDFLWQLAHGVSAVVKDAAVSAANVTS